MPKIRARIEEGLARIPVAEYDKGRLEQEMIFYIEKLDVNEERQRLGQHLRYFIETMEGERVRARNSDSSLRKWAVRSIHLAQRAIMPHAAHSCEDERRARTNQGAGAQRYVILFQGMKTLCIATSTRADWGFCDLWPKLCATAVGCGCRFLQPTCT